MPLALASANTLVPQFPQNFCEIGCLPNLCDYECWRQWKLWAGWVLDGKGDVVTLKEMMS